MGFLLFPREWEGLHEAFPKFPEQLDARSPVVPTLHALVFGTLGGLAWNFTRALQRKPLSHGVLNGIGFCTIPFTAWAVASNERQRAKVIKDVQAILQADNTSLPRRRYIKIIPESTIDMSAIIGGLLAMNGLMLYRRTPNFPKVGFNTSIGAFTVGQFVGLMVHTNYYSKSFEASYEEYKLDLEKGSHIFVERTGKPPPPYLYGALQSMSQIGKQKSSSWPPFRAENPVVIEPASTIADDQDQASEWLAAQPEPPGTEPHMTIVAENGQKVVLAQRDFDWNPESQQAGLEMLQDHLEDLYKARARAVQSAEFLWNSIAKRESQHYPPYKRQQDSKSITLEKKALELLSSIHKQHYAQIADLDWCIANTKKLMLQLQSEGKWLPNNLNSPVASEARDKLLASVRQHRKNLEVQSMTVDETLNVMPVPDEEKADIRRALSENLAATTKLLKDLERDANEEK